jgi:hypothetical protein
MIDRSTKKNLNYPGLTNLYANISIFSALTHVKNLTKKESDCNSIISKGNKTSKGSKRIKEVREIE